VEGKRLTNNETLDDFKTLLLLLGISDPEARSILLPCTASLVEFLHG
jgi:hypothetical protein